MTACASILAVTAVGALGGSFLVPKAKPSPPAMSFDRHAARVSHSVHASTGSVHAAHVRFHRSSAETDASGSFTRRRFGSADRTFGRTDTSTNSSNTTHALADPCSGLGALSTCFLNQGKGVDGTGGSVASLNAKNTTSIGSPVLVPTTEPAIPGGTKGSGGNANNTTGNGKTPTGTGGAGTGGEGTGGGTGTGGTTFTPVTNIPPRTNANKTTGGENHRHHFPGEHPFPGQFPVVAGMGHGSFVGGPVAVGGSIAPVAVAPVASALPPVTAPSAPRLPTTNCLTKDYLQTGVVMFRDVCSQEGRDQQLEHHQPGSGQQRLPEQGKSAERRRAVQGQLHQRMGDEPAAAEPSSGELRSINDRSNGTPARAGVFAFWPTVGVAAPRTRPHPTGDQSLSATRKLPIA